MTGPVHPRSGPDRPLTGEVAAFDEHAGLGTVTSGGAEYPFHCTQIADGSRSIAVGSAVRFTVRPGRLGRWEAGGVTPI